MAKAAKQRIHGILKPRLSSCSALFEQRGDKWGGSNRPLPPPHNPTPAEQAIETVLAKMGASGQYAAETAFRLREANREDPDMDRWTKAGFASKKKEYIQPRGTPIEATPQRRMTNVLHRGNMAMRPKSLKIGEKKAKQFDPSSEESKLNKLTAGGLSREKARQILEAERKRITEQRADYAAKKFGR